MVKFSRLFINLLVVGVVVACVRRKNDAMVYWVKEWNGREIVIPDNLNFTVYGKDTVQYPKHLQYTIVGYVDSAGCFSCKLQLPMWKNFICQLDSIYPGKVSVLLFLHSKSKSELLYVLKNNGFDYPVCIDENDGFNRLNHFPPDMAYKDNREKAISNRLRGMAYQGTFCSNPSLRQSFVCGE